jgi:hypothetical protein
MTPTQLQIVISAVDQAADILEGVQDQLTEMGTAADNAADQITNSLTAAEEAFAEQAAATVDTWAEAADGVGESFEAVVPSVQSALAQLASTNATAAQQVLDQWQAEGQAMEESLAATMNEVDDAMVSDATVAGEAAGTAAGNAFGGFFGKMIIGYALEKIGSFLSGGIDSAVAAAQQSTNQIANLTTQIDSQKASIAQNEAALQKWTGTTVEVNAAHEKAAANIQAETLKIQELQQQLAPLMQAQSGLPGQITQIENATLGWIGSNQALESTLQVFSTTLGPMLEFIGVFLIVSTLFMRALVYIDPVWFALVGLAAVIALLVAVWSTFHVQIMAFLDDLNANTGVIDFFKQSWASVSENFTTELLPALEQLWAALQPLKPLLQAMAEVIGATLLGAIVLLVAALTTAVNIFTQLLTIATNIATFFTNVFVAAINKVESAIATLANSTGFKAVSSLVGGAVSGVSSVIGSIPGFAAGGIVNSPTLAMVGEAGPEAIIPLSAFNGGGNLAGIGGGVGGGSGNINVYIQGGNYLNQGGAQQIAQALATMIGRQLKLTTI